MKYPLDSSTHLCDFLLERGVSMTAIHTAKSTNQNNLETFLYHYYRPMKKVTTKLVPLSEVVAINRGINGLSFWDHLCLANQIAVLHEKKLRKNFDVLDARQYAGAANFYASNETASNGEGLAEMSHFQANHSNQYILTGNGNHRTLCAKLFGVPAILANITDYQIDNPACHYAKQLLQIYQNFLTFLRQQQLTYKLRSDKNSVQFFCKSNLIGQFSLHFPVIFSDRHLFNSTDVHLFRQDLNQIKLQLPQKQNSDIPVRSNELSFSIHLQTVTAEYQADFNNWLKSGFLSPKTSGFQYQYYFSGRQFTDFALTAAEAKQQVYFELLAKVATARQLGIPGNLLTSVSVQPETFQITV
ncbi:hypothetical protein BSQ39_00755 [Loigolactobacillus backii]|uniref:hypothetical protein n=1 Tax=Loigolactobacillus backii TaxID=375175 RepID=UPI000C1CB6BA|nr:hypothetical protein [Loigolactobacillus backii]PIO82189.1 hypothetical protein BSQ39_00755 [Loigolactobacillus backii]